MSTAELAPRDAQQRVERFVSRFGPGYRRLARHAALPLVLTPELLHYLRNAFLRGQVPWVAEADLLLSDLCEEVGYEQYVMHPAVRARLITELRAEPDGPERVKEVARLLLQYLRRLERAGVGPGRDALLVQQWSALAYLDSDRVSRGVHEALAALVARLQACPNEVNALAALANITRNLAPQLDQSPELVALAREITGLLTGEGAPSGQQDGQEPHRIQPEDVQPVPRSLVTQFPDQVGLAETVSLLVSLSAGPDQGSSLPVALPVGSAIDVVVVPKRGLVLEGKGKGTLVVSDQEETLPLQFKLRAIELGPTRLQVHALHQGQSLGMARLAPTVAVGQGYVLLLMPSVNDVSDIPTEGERLIIVAAVHDVLHFRLFDGDGKVVVDTNENGLADQAQQIENLRKQLESLWPPHSLTSSEKDQVITAVTSILTRVSRKQGTASKSGVIRIFVSYSHKDKRWLEEFQKHIQPLIRGGHIDLWDDTGIALGQKWREEIIKAIEAADIAVLLVSPDFLASEFIANEELPRLLDGRKTTVFWIAIDYTNYKGTPIAKYQCANNPSTPLSSLKKSERSRAWVEIGKKLLGMIPVKVKAPSPVSRPVISQVSLLRIVVASPSDVQAELDAVVQIVEELNRAARGMVMEVKHWETDAYPGFHPEGPQGLIDPILRIEECDLLVCIFWKNLGSKFRDGSTEVEHVFRKAYKSWLEKNRPQIMMYFNQKEFLPKSEEEISQLKALQEFRDRFSKQGVWGYYRGKDEFKRLFRHHLTNFVSISNIESTWPARESASSLKDLRALIARRRVMVVVGAGVSLAATNGNRLASWTGLLEDGLLRCRSVYSSLSEEWLKRKRDDLNSGDPDDLQSVAEVVASKLGSPSGGEYRRWLRESVGALQVSNPTVLEALRDLKVPLATTNYDSLIEQVTGQKPVTWRDRTEVERVIRRDKRGAVLHLHGYWADPESVILGIRSYEILDPFAQSALKALLTFETFLFVGCGEGLANPNFGALLAWMRKVSAGSPYPHYLLGLAKDVSMLRKRYPDEQLILVLSYGSTHDDLVPFLRSLISDTVSNRMSL